MPIGGRDLGPRAAQLLNRRIAGGPAAAGCIFNHATDGPPRGGRRGNGFAAVGLMETWTGRCPPHRRERALAIFVKQMKGLAAWQAPDGRAWRETSIGPGAPTAEENRDAMILKPRWTRGCGSAARFFARMQPVAIRAGARCRPHRRRRAGAGRTSAAAPGAARRRATYFDRPGIEGRRDRGGGDWALSPADGSASLPR